MGEGRLTLISRDSLLRAVNSGLLRNICRRNCLCVSLSLLSLAGCPAGNKTRAALKMSGHKVQGGVFQLAEKDAQRKKSLKPTRSVMNSCRFCCKSIAAGCNKFEGKCYWEMRTAWFTFCGDLDSPLAFSVGRMYGFISLRSHSHIMQCAMR